jgi:hypothetical protein
MNTVIPRQWKVILHERPPSQIFVAHLLAAEPARHCTLACSL